MVDHYKKEKKKHYQDNPQPNRNPNSKDKKNKRSISCHPKTFSAKLHKKESSPHDIHYATNPFKKDSQVAYFMIHVFKG